MEWSDFTFCLDEIGQRLDTVLVNRYPHLSRMRINALIREGHVLLDGVDGCKPSQRIKMEGKCSIRIPQATPLGIDAEPIAIPIVYEDEAILVVNKPAGMVVHPSAGHTCGTLVHALLHHCGASLSGINGVMRPGIVHRLDKDTTGLLVVAKHDHAHQQLSKQFAKKDRNAHFERSYLALVWGVPSRSWTTIDRPIGRHRLNRLKQAIIEGPSGKPACTMVRLVEVVHARLGIALVQCVLHSGRTHQIRVHLESIGFPIVGDPLYGRGFLTKILRGGRHEQECLQQFQRQALHAHRLGFIHPTLGHPVSFEVGVPEDFANLKDRLLFCDKC